MMSTNEGGRPGAESPGAWDSPELLRIALDQSEHFVGLLDLDGRVIAVNATALEFANVSVEEVLGKPFWETIWWSHSPELAARVRMSVGEALQGRTVRFVATHERDDGAPRHVDFSIKPLTIDGEMRYLMPEGRDITDLADTKLKLEESEQRYQQIFDTNTAVKLIINPKSGRIVDANDAACRFYGFEKSELLKLKIQDINTLPRERVDEEMQRAKSERRLFFNFKHRVASGEVRDVEVHSGPLTVAGESLLHSIIIDVTERRKLEEALARAQRMEAIGQLAGGIAHDFNNILTVILGYVELGRRALTTDHPARDSVDEIGSAASRAADITRQLLALAKKQVVEPEIVSLNQLVFRLDRLLRRLIGEDIELVVIPGEELGAVAVDPGRFEQLLVNLAVNARDAMSGGGRLTIATENARLTEQVDDLAPGAYVRMRVSDTGSGIPLEMQQRIFEPFFTTKSDQGGSGLGLATSLSIVEQAGGRIAVISDSGRGATFEILLPMADAAAEEPEAERISVLPRGKGTLLVVEDEPAVHRLIVTTLRRAGYTVVAASNGDEALRAMAEHATPVDLVVSDVVMPLMGGRELATRLWRLHPGLPVLFMSGYPRDLDELVLSGDNVGFLAKPFTPDALASKVHALLSETARARR